MNDLAVEVAGIHSVMVHQPKSTCMKMKG
jgi:hypothetical protein